MITAPDSTPRTYVRAGGGLHSLPEHLAVAEAIAELRAKAERDRAYAERLIADLDAGEVDVSWWRGPRPASAPDPAE